MVDPRAARPLDPCLRRKQASANVTFAEFLEKQPQWMCVGYMKPEERRRHPRKSLQQRVVIHRKAESPHATLYCTTVDVSAEGLQLRIRQALEAGEPVVLVVHMPGQSGSFRLHGETRWCAAANHDKSYLLGVQLTGMDAPEFEEWRNLFI